MKRALVLLSLLAACAREPETTSPAPAPAAALPEEAVPEASGRVAITVDGMGFHPSTIHARTGQPLELVFTRVSEAGCAQELIVPSLGVRKPLPMNQPVSVNVTPTSELRFACGMDMLRGHVVVHGAGTP